MKEIARHFVLSILVSLIFIGAWTYFLAEKLGAGQIVAQLKQAIQQYRAPTVELEKIDFNSNGPTLLGPQVLRPEYLERNLLQWPLPQPEMTFTGTGLFVDPQVVDEISKLNVPGDLKKSLLENYLRSGIYFKRAVPKAETKSQTPVNGKTY